ncbi:type II toxin-antitoxin system VapC family toxin [Cellulomonas sp. KRMCY2]|uniref:type II toxin-antitoxin system VapC family toxin n=1 Tax=Cellulomonas sp. KRMCY2 TaxID=1304865 RepID=UPI00045E912F|nr:type II toxin-antitoxin system VapC family toxin [Cellulomonas sp. KRMCY2]
MRILADTHVLLWWLADDPALPAHQRDALADEHNDVFFSAVSISEIAIKASLGKLEAPADPTAALLSGGFEALPLTAAHAERLRDLPGHHKDPFDRMLVAQAQCEGLVVATLDSQIGAYAVDVL